MTLLRRRALAAALVVAALVLLPAWPAAADPPAPTDYRSEVTDIRPDVDGVTVEVVGGDGFLEVAVAPDHTAEVAGYSGEPYLRFLDDGTVEENEASAASVLNQSRTRTDQAVPSGGAPRWEQVATDGRWAWHDHRIHNMSSRTPAGARTAEGITWEVPLTVDGTDVVVDGRYRLLARPSPLPWVLLALVTAGLVIGVGRIVKPMTATGVAVLLAGGGGLVSGVAQRGADPAGAPTSALVVVLPALAVVAGIIVVMQRGRVLRAVAALAGAAAAVGWALVRLPVLWSAVLPTSLPAGVDRAFTALALGLAGAAAALVVSSGALTPPPPTTAPEDDPAPTSP